MEKIAKTNLKKYRNRFMGLSISEIELSRESSTVQGETSRPVTSTDLDGKKISWALDIWG